jgi:hypothetical protein
MQEQKSYKTGVFSISIELVYKIETINTLLKCKKMSIIYDIY